MKFTKTFAIFIAMLTLCLALAGCGKKENPEVSMKVYTKAILHQDNDSLKKTGFNKKDVHDTLLSNFADGFMSTSGGLYSREQANRIGEVYLKKLQKVDIGATGGVVEGDTAKVQVVVGQIDMRKLDDPAFIYKMQREIMRHPELQTRQQQTDFITKMLIKALEDMPVGGAVPVNVECKYDNMKGMWVPKDPELFMEDLEDAIVKTF